MNESNPVVCRLWRGDAVEAIHRGAWVCVDTTGAVVAGVSDPLQPVFPRSASKSFQALPLVTTGAADAFGFDAGDLALAMASHSGEAIHVERVLASLERLGLTEDDLQCGPQQPIAAWSNQTKRRASNNCSGKHVGFLAVARQLDTDPARYLDPHGAVQAAVRAAVLSLTGVDEADLGQATDGCSAPTFRLPLARLAEGIARVADPVGTSPEVAAACERMTAAAAAHPELVGGTRHRFDTDLLRVSSGRLFSKVGAEGAFVVGVVGAGVGYAFKVDDGNERALAPLIIDVLVAAGHLTSAERAGLTEWDDRVRTNWDGLEIGHLEVASIS